MKKLLASGLGIAALALASSANAADLPPRVAYKAPPPAVAPAPYNWSGFYIGGHFGGGWARNDWQERGVGASDVCLEDLGLPAADLIINGNEFEGGCLSDLTSSGLLNPNVGSHNAIGPLGGFQAGFNWQPLGSHWVFGVEGQFSFADLKGDHQNSRSGSGFLEFEDDGFEMAAINGTLNERFFTKVQDIATIAARIGITSDWMDRTLFYVKGGGAWARNQYRVTSQFAADACVIIGDANECMAANGAGSWSGSENRWGWMAGVGVEFGLFGNWTAKIEYDYLGFGRRDVRLNGGGSATIDCHPSGDCSGDLFPGTGPATISGSSTFSRTFSIDENIQLIKLGLNYRFNFGKAAPVVARY